MRNLFKKSLAICLAIALCLTAMVGLTVSAEDVTIAGTITANGAEVEAGATSATVSFTLAATDLSEVILSLEASEGAEITAATAPEGTTAYAVIPKAEDDFSLIAFSTYEVGVVTSEATVNVTVTFAEAADYTVTATLGYGMGATNKEELIVVADPAVANITVKAEEHVHDWGEGEVTTAPGCENAGVRTYTCSGCGETKTEAIDAAGHNYEGAVAYMNTEDGKWYKDCTVCGASLETDAVIDNTIMLARSIIITEKIGLKFATATSMVTSAKAKFDDFYVNVKTQKYNNDYNLEDKNVDIASDNTFDVTPSITAYSFTDMAAYEIAIPVETCIHYVKDGKVVAVSDTYTDTIAERALVYGKDYIDNLEKGAMYFNLVEYGIQAQNYFATRNAGKDIASAEAPSFVYNGVDYSGYVTETLPELKSEFSYNSAEGVTAGVARSVLVSSSNALVYKLYVTDTTVPSKADLSKLRLEISYESCATQITEPITASVNATDMELISGTYQYIFDKIAIYDSNQKVTANVYSTDSDEPIITIVYSVDSNAKSCIESGDSVEFWSAMAIFGDSARTFFGYN